MKPRNRSRGVTLLELLVVLMILSIILTAAVKTWDVTLERGRAQTTSRKLDQLVKVIVGDRDYIVAGRRADFGFVGDIGRLPASLQELVAFPVSPPESSRWRGPYLRSTFNESPDGFRVDGWGDTIIYGPQINPDSLWVRSLGGRGMADKTRWQTVVLPYSRTALLGNAVDGQIVDVQGDPPPPPSTNDTILRGLMVKLEYPFNGTLHRDSLTWPGRLKDDGSFEWANIPQGTHRLVAMYVNFYKTGLPETTMTTADVTVYPGIGAHGVRMRLNYDW